jgi:TRAP-type C4-dicarboxylate transport system substrate-binding protein
MKIRVQTSDLWIDLMRALGANPTPLPFGEVFTSLQSGVIEGAENTWPFLREHGPFSRSDALLLRRPSIPNVRRSGRLPPAVGSG